MPTFDFACTACANVFEYTRPFGSKTNPQCPACGAKKTEKQIAPPTVHFKGSGFYRTDSSAKPVKGVKTGTEAKPAESTPSTETTAEPAAEKPKTEKASKTSEK